MSDGVLGAGELPPDMSIPGISAGMLNVGAGVGSLPDMSIPGISAGMLAVGAGALPDISIPGMSAGMPVVLAGVGEVSDISIPPMSAGMLAAGAGVSDLTPKGTAARTMVAADDSCAEVSVNDPMTAKAPSAAATDTTRTRRHSGCP
jgi:hypothetical protein